MASNGAGSRVKVHTKQSDQAHLVIGVRSRPLRWLYLATREVYWRVIDVTPVEEEPADTFCAVVPGKHEFTLAGAFGGRQTFGERLEHRGVVFLGLEEGVLFEHLLDFLMQLERRQLQQPDRLLQLRRQRQVLG